jgi:hypothetical protein
VTALDATRQDVCRLLGSMNRPSTSASASLSLKALQATRLSLQSKRISLPSNCVCPVSEAGIGETLRSLKSRSKHATCVSMITAGD